MLACVSDAANETQALERLISPGEEPIMLTEAGTCPRWTEEGLRLQLAGSSPRLGVPRHECLQRLAASCPADF